MATISVEIARAGAEEQNTDGNETEQEWTWEHQRTPWPPRRQGQRRGRKRKNEKPNKTGNTKHAVDNGRKIRADGRTGVAGATDRETSDYQLIM
jgi:hypothetical protein